ncbi:hypothetical protein [Salinimicrobium terrae]|uniref:hypothetical protein n=1 Tax=Salinimicrobium terrae TaxID=470866 RepID=UPI0004093001|nr:hypothetical protein [Salinimicrobium terrae]
MNLLNLFKPTPQKLERRNQKRIFQLLYEFANSPQLDDLITSDKPFRTITFWSNPDTAIPDFFYEWIDRKGLKITRNGDQYSLLNNSFTWRVTKYKFKEFQNYYYGYYFEPKFEVSSKPFKKEILHLIIEIERNYPKKVEHIHYNHEKQRIEGCTLNENKTKEDLDIVFIQNQLKARLESLKQFDVNQYLMRTSMAKFNPYIVEVRRNLEGRFQEIAEDYLKKLAKYNIPVEGVPFKKELEKEANYLAENLLDDYDLYENGLERGDLRKAIDAAKTKTITKYLNI